MTEQAKGGASAFSDLSNKLSNQPSKKSLFERQKAEAEAKRLKAEEETAAVYEDFVKSFDHDDGNDELLNAVGHGGGGRGGPRGGRGGGIITGGSAGKRHFSARGGRSSGPGSLGAGVGVRNSGPGSLGPVPSAVGGHRGQKRAFNDYSQEREPDRDRSHRMFSFDDQNRPTTTEKPSLDTASAFPAEGEEDHRTRSDEKAVSKPTLHLSSLPPGTSPAFIKSLIPTASVTVEHVRILPASTSSQSSTDRRSTSAIVTLLTDTPATEIDTLVSHLQNRYLGFGCYLSISRHLSSAVLGAGGITAPVSGMNNLPFGARPVPQHTNLSRGPPPRGLGSRRGGMAPPASYTSSTPYNQRGSKEQLHQVLVTPPSDLKQLRLIHLTLEALLTHGPEFEALLMTRKEVQRGERWVWLWDARSRGGVYYRWRLWAICTGTDSPGSRVGRAAHFVFERSAPWIPPETGLKFEYTTKMEELIEDEAYDSSDEEDYDDESRIQRRRRADQLAAEGMASAAGDIAVVDTDGTGYLNPLAKAKLVHLLARLPDSNTKLRRGDVARVTAFAIEHAGEGAEEVSTIITANIQKPLCSTDANPDRRRQQDQRQAQQKSRDEGGSKTPPPEMAIPEAPVVAVTSKEAKVDTTSASLVGLYVVSDILMSSTTSGVRHAWRYRALFETSLTAQRIFEHLGHRDRELGWGRLKAEKWKRSVQTLLSTWEGWCVFPQASQEEFVNAFRRAAEMKAEAEESGGGGRKEETTIGWKKAGTGGTVGKWRSVEDEGRPEHQGTDASVDDNVDGMVLDNDHDNKDRRYRTAAGREENLDDLDGELMATDSDDDEVGNDEDLDGVSMVDSSDDDNSTKNNQSTPNQQQQPQQSPLDPIITTTTTTTNKASPDTEKQPPSHQQQEEEQQIQAPPPPRQKPTPRSRSRPKAVDMFAADDDDDDDVPG